MVDIPIKHLFVEYRFWIEKTRPYKTVADELAALARNGDNFRRIIEPKKGDCVFGLATFMERFDIRTAYPLFLFLLDADLTNQDWDAISIVLESYLLRRSFLNWSTKAYNRIFLNLVKSLQKAGRTPANLKTALSALEGESSAWPADDVFFAAWQTNHAYHDLNNAKIVHILRRLSDSYLTNKNEQITIDCPLSVEHLLPQSWLDNWPLPNGDKGMTWDEMLAVEADDPRAIATRSRNAALQTMGNLTILTQGLNSSVSNAGWSTKKPELLKSSLLPINQQLHGYDIWDEDAIQNRGKDLFTKATKIWPAPEPKTKA
jgi:hypothetical protein